MSLSSKIFNAVGYHGSHRDSINLFLSQGGIDCSYNRGNDIFLGGGFYLWRDSWHRAYKWSVRHVENLDECAVLGVEIECENNKMLNFTSTYSSEDEKELNFLKLYLKVIENLQENGSNGLYFGRFIDYLIENDVDIQLVSVHDLTHDLKLFGLEDPLNEGNKTYFALGDIQICIKDVAIIVDKARIENDNS